MGRDPREVVEALQLAINAGDVDAAVALFHDDASVSIPALGPREGKEAIRELFEFCAGIELRWELRDFRTDGRATICTADQYDGWAGAAGIAPLQYESFSVTVAGGLIVSLVGAWSQTTSVTLGHLVERFTPWAVEAHPELYAANGDFIYSFDSGAGFSKAMREFLAKN